MAYCTNTEVFERMGYDDARGEALTRRVDDAILAATTTVDNYTSRSFEPATATNLFGQAGYMLRVPDLISVTTLKVDDSDDGTFETTIESGDYELDTVHTTTGWPFEIVRLLERDFPSGSRRRHRIQIVGSWGWAAVPAPVNQACSLLASRFAQRGVSALFGIQSFGELGIQGIRSSDPDVALMLDDYRQPGIA